jgi:FKBP-type peptidyl-prolyl cis-trans isomerase FklB
MNRCQYSNRTGAKFLKEVSQREGIITLKSGMLIEILKSTDKEDAKSPTKFDTCEVTYSGTLKDGTPFDAGTTSFSPNQVIKGWTEAMQLMGEGDKWKLYIPYDLAYGERGSPPKSRGQEAFGRVKGQGGGAVNYLSLICRLGSMGR